MLKQFSLNPASAQSGTPAPSDRPAPEPHPSSYPTRCEHRNAEGKRCGMLRARFHSSLCAYHAEKQHLRENPLTENLAPELLGSLADLRSAAAVNFTLGKLLILLASKRIPNRDGAVIAYVCQLLLQSVSAVRHEISCTEINKTGEKDLRKVLAATISLLENQAPAKGHT